MESKVRTYLHERIPKLEHTCMNAFHKEGIILEIKENEPFLRSKIRSLNRKEIPKTKFLEFFYVRGESGHDF